MKWQVFAFIFGLLRYSSARLAGPYFMWGHEKIKNLKMSTLADEVGEEHLASLLRETKAVVVFLRNSTCRLDAINYPKFRQLILTNFWTYLPQQRISVKLFEKNDNVELVDLVGSATQRDTEITKLFEEKVRSYEKGQVIGIMAYCKDEFRNNQQNRQAIYNDSESQMPADTNAMHKAPGPSNAILFTVTSPVLTMKLNGQKHSFNLLNPDPENKSALEDRQVCSHMNSGFKANNTSLQLRFTVAMSASMYWSFSSVEFEYKEYNNILPLVGSHGVVFPSESHSHRCSPRTLFFRSKIHKSTLDGFQIQPWLKGANKFSDANTSSVETKTAPIEIESGLIWGCLLFEILLINERSQ